MPLSSEWNKRRVSECGKDREEHNNAKTEGDKGDDPKVVAEIEEHINDKRKAFDPKRLHDTVKKRCMAFSKGMMACSEGYTKERRSEGGRKRIRRRKGSWRAHRSSTCPWKRIERAAVERSRVVYLRMYL